MKPSLLAILVFGLVGCATVPPSSSLQRSVAAVDAAYRALPTALPSYNTRTRDLCELLEKSEPSQFSARLAAAGVSLVYPELGLPLRHVEVPALRRDDPSAIGVPVVLGYDTARAPLYPPEGLFVDATALYEQTARGRKLTLRPRGASITIGGHSFPIVSDSAAAARHLQSRARKLAGSGFMSMIRPASMRRKAQIYLLDPYDPQKIPLLMVHGLQSTPVAFATMVESLRSDPEVRARYQLWQFYYPSGTPVLANAVALRESLARTLHTLDPKDRDPATRRIVVVGHSMGGVISHTLVSSAGSRLWDSVFRVPARELHGDPAAIRDLQQIFKFERDPRIARVIFMAAPHRGSSMADSFIGVVGNSLARLSPMEEAGFSRLSRENPHAMQPGAAAFYDGGRFSAVRTLSPRSTALIALSGLPIPIPFHSVIGQTRPGPRERGSDGVVPYTSSHLDGARSELIVRSGHGVIGNSAAIEEVLRILHEDLRSTLTIPKPPSPSKL